MVQRRVINTGKRGQNTRIMFYFRGDEMMEDKIEEIRIQLQKELNRNLSISEAIRWLIRVGLAQSGTAIEKLREAQAEGVVGV